MRISRLVTIITIMALCLMLPICSSATSAEVDLTKLTYKELQTVLTDISNDNQVYHTPTDFQKKSVLAATKAATHEYYSKKSLTISGWAWYDSEYTYTKDWDFYTLKTHVDYKDSNNKSKKAIIYSEVYKKNGQFVISFLKTDNTIIIDSRSDYGDTLWFTEPEARISKAIGIDLSTYTVDELTNLRKKVLDEIKENHTVSKNEANVILSLTKSTLEQYFLKKNYELQSYAWYDSEYTYIKDWDYYWLETHVDYKTDTKSSKKTEKIYSEVCRVDGEYELVYLRMGAMVIKDTRQELIVSTDAGIPRYSKSANGNTDHSSDNSEVPTAEPEIIYITPEPTPETTPEIIYVTPEPVAEESVPPKTLSDSLSDGSFNTELTQLTDEELVTAANAIKAEQKARIKTHILLDYPSLTLHVNRSQKVTATVEDLPEGEKKPKLTWSTSDKKIALVNNGTIKGVSVGEAIITCSATLSDGTTIDVECPVQVIIPAKGLTVSQVPGKIGIDETIQLDCTIKPENATIQTLSFVSSDESIAKVDEKGNITGVSNGTTTIIVSTTDGSDKSISVTIQVLDLRISQPTALLAVVTGVGNECAEDVFAADGYNYDKRKLHNCGYLWKYYSLFNEGEWSTPDNGNTWHVERFIIQSKKTGGFRMYKFDISFDGKNYYLKNGWVDYGKTMSSIERQDPSKWGEENLSNLSYYSIFIIPPEMLKEK